MIAADRPRIYGLRCADMCSCQVRILLPTCSDESILGWIDKNSELHGKSFTDRRALVVLAFRILKFVYFSGLNSQKFVSFSGLNYLLIRGLTADHIPPVLQFSAATGRGIDEVSKESVEKGRATDRIAYRTFPGIDLVGYNHSRWTQVRIQFWQALDF